jgi:hypothetical protein
MHRHNQLWNSRDAGYYLKSSGFGLMMGLDEIKNTERLLEPTKKHIRTEPGYRHISHFSALLPVILVNMAIKTKQLRYSKNFNLNKI